jgi:hypothetical protein
MPYNIKTSGPTIRRFSLTEPSFTELCKQLSQLNGHPPATITYTDPDGDVVCLNSDIELREAFNLAGCGVLKLDVSPAEPRPTSTITTNESARQAARQATRKAIVKAKEEWKLATSLQEAMKAKEQSFADMMEAERKLKNGLSAAIQAKEQFMEEQQRRHKAQVEEMKRHNAAKQIQAAARRTILAKGKDWATAVRAKERAVAERRRLHQAKIDEKKRANAAKREAVAQKKRLLRARVEEKNRANAARHAQAAVHRSLLQAAAFKKANWKRLKSAARTEAAKTEVNHPGIQCSQCSAGDIIGTRFRCLDCKDFNLCAACEDTNEHPVDHIMIKMRLPTPEPEMVVPCSDCKIPIRGARYICMVCSNINLCSCCEARGAHAPSHPLLKTRTAASQSSPPPYRVPLLPMAAPREIDIDSEISFSDGDDYEDCVWIDDAHRGEVAPFRGSLMASIRTFNKQQLNKTEPAAPKRDDVLFDWSARLLHHIRAIANANELDGDDYGNDGIVEQPKRSLFADDDDDDLFADDDDDDLFGAKSTAKAAPKKNAAPKQEPKPKLPKPAASACGLFGDDDEDLFGAKSASKKKVAPKKPEQEPEPEPPKPASASAGGLFADDDDDDLFGSSKKPTLQQEEPVVEAEDLEQNAPFAAEIKQLQAMGFLFEREILAAALDLNKGDVAAVVQVLLPGA